MTDRDVRLTQPTLKVLRFLLRECTKDGRALKFLVRRRLVRAPSIRRFPTGSSRLAHWRMGKG